MNKIRRWTQNSKFIQYGSHFFSYCISTTSKRFACLQNKIFKHFIPFLLNSSIKATNIWTGSCICLFFKTLHIALSRELRFGLDGGHEESLINLRFSFWFGFGVKQILDSLSFLYLLTHTGLNFNEKVLE